MAVEGALRLVWARWRRLAQMWRGFFTVAKTSSRVSRAERFYREGRLEESLRELDVVFVTLRSTGLARHNPGAFGVALVGARNMYWIARELGVPERAREALCHAIHSIERLRVDAAALDPGGDHRFHFEAELLEMRDVLSRLPPLALN